MIGRRSGPTRRATLLGMGAAASMAGRPVAAAGDGRPDYPVRSPFDRPFSPDSIWNIGIAAGATIAPANLAPPEILYVDPVCYTNDLSDPLRPMNRRANEAFITVDEAALQADSGAPATPSPIPAPDGFAYHPLQTYVAAHRGPARALRKPSSHNGCGAHLQAWNGELWIFQSQAENRGPGGLAGPFTTNHRFRYPERELWEEPEMHGLLPFHAGPHSVGTRRGVSDSPALARDPSRGGAHGGSRGSAIGGLLTVRDLAGEDERSITHALCATVPSRWLRRAERLPAWTSAASDASYVLDEGRGHVWPAHCADRGYDDPDGPNFYAAPPETPEAMRLGALLTLDPAFDPGGLPCPFARRLAWAMRDFGLYCMDVTGRGFAARRAAPGGGEGVETVWRPSFALEVAYGPQSQDKNVHVHVYRRWGVDIGLVDTGDANLEAPTRRYAASMREILAAAVVVVDNAPARPGGGPIGAPRRRAAHVQPPFDWLGGRLTVGGAPAPRDLRAAATLERRVNGGAWAPAPTDLYGRPLANRAAPADAAAGYVVFADLRASLSGAAPALVEYRMRAGGLASAPLRLDYGEARILPDLPLA